MIMRNFFRNVLVISSLALIVFACKKDDEPVKPELTISAADKAQSFTAAAGSKTIAVTTNGDYTATVETGKDWITVTAKTATGFTINVTENTAYDTRTAKVTLALTGVESIEITVTQIGLAPALVIANTSLIFEYAAGDTLVPVTTNGEYTVTVASNNPWVTISDKTATSFKINVAKNPTSTGRSATVTVALTGTTLSVEITVAQNLQPVLAVEPSGDIVVNTSLRVEKTLTVRTIEGADYTVTVVDSTDTAPDWVIVEKAGDALAITIEPRIYYPDPNVTPSGQPAFVSAELPERKATVTISVDGVDGATPVTFDVIQSAHLDKSKMVEYYLDNDNQTLFGDPATTGIHMMFNNISYSHHARTSRNDFYITAPNTDGSTAPETPNELSWTFPFTFTFDLGVETHLNSFKITPRTNRYSDRRWEYGLGSPYQFAVYGTNEDPKTNPGSFVKLGDFTCEYLGETINKEEDDVNEDGTPKLNEDGTPVKKWAPEPITDADRSAITPEKLTFNQITSEACIKAGQGYDFALAPTETPVRYLRFEIKKVWGMIDVKDPETNEVTRAPLTYVNIQELWFWGDPATGN
jgi:hypothetical protein